MRKDNLVGLKDAEAPCYDALGYSAIHDRSGPAFAKRTNDAAYPADASDQFGFKRRRPTVETELIYCTTPIETPLNTSRDKITSSPPTRGVFLCVDYPAIAARMPSAAETRRVSPESQSYETSLTWISRSVHPCKDLRQQWVDTGQIRR